VDAKALLPALGRLFGGACFLCRGAADDALCAACDADLPVLGAARCPRCALPSPRGATCGRCLAHAPAFDATVAALAYAFPADALVHALTFRGALALAAVLGAHLERALGDALVDLIAPVPLSAQRLRERGFNPALEIARTLSRRGPLVPALLERSRDTPPQTALPWGERQRNVRGAFRVARGSEVTDASVAVVDDVMTTGATLDEIARTLKEAGAARVSCWVVARTPAPD
jgi:ComF family protein